MSARVFPYRGTRSAPASGLSIDPPAVAPEEVQSIGREAQCHGSLRPEVATVGGQGLERLALEAEVEDDPVAGGPAGRRVNFAC